MRAHTGRFRAAVGGLPPAFWTLWAGLLVNRLASFVATFLALYLVRERGFAPDEAGRVVALFGAGVLVSGPLGGTLADLVGRRATMLVSLCSGAAVAGTIGFLRSPSWLAVFTFLAAATNELYRPAMNAAITDVVPAGDRARAWGITYWAANLGWSFGLALGGVAAGGTVRYGHVLTAFGGMSGFRHIVLTDTAGQPLAYLTLFAERLDGARIMFEQFWSYTDAEGRYVISGLGTGDYRVGLLLWNGMVLYYGGSTNPDEAVPVHVIQGQETPGIDFSVGTGGGVRGTVTDAVSGNPIEFAEVMVMDGMGMLYSWGGTTADGTYEALWLPAGSYKVLASAPCYQEEWFKDAASFEEGNWVHVVADAVTTHVDFTLTPVEGCVR